MYLSEVISIFNQEDLIKLLEKYDYAKVFKQKSPDIDRFKNHWSFVGNNDSNASIIGILKNGEKGIIERISNAIDAVIERKKNEYQIQNPKSVNDIVVKAFPQYHHASSKVRKLEIPRINSADASDQVVVSINDGKKSNKPTVDVLDLGTGIHGDDFHKTILSLHGGNKIKSDKSYMIGAFGQGGSTSLAFSTATLIVSKFENEYYFTVVSVIKPKYYKNKVYIYLTEDSKKIIKLHDDLQMSRNHEYEDKFFNDTSGTLIRMIDCDITKRFRDNDINKPRMLNDYFNTELFDVGIPVKVIENRKQYKMNLNDQNRYVHGSNMKLKTTKYRLSDYSGSFNIEYKGDGYLIDYHTILPKDEDLWGKDKECKKVYQTFNIHEKPIIFTVNGQYINGVNFTKIKNIGLNFLQYRLLVHVNLDILGTKKYDFFTTDRDEIISSDFTTDFINLLVNQLSQVDPLKQINEIISEKAIQSVVDDEFIDNITKKVRNKYNQFLKLKEMPKSTLGKSLGGKYSQEEVFYDEIIDLNITNTRESYKYGSQINIVLWTGARKDVNKEKSNNISCFIDEKEIYPNQTYMNGRIQYSLNDINLGDHNIKFTLFDGIESLKESNPYFFKVEEDLDNSKEKNASSLNLKINQMEKDSTDLICDLIKIKNSLTINIYLEHKSLYPIFRTKQETELKELKKNLIEPIALYCLFMDDDYINLDNKNKNSVMASLIQTMIEHDRV